MNSTCTSFQDPSVRTEEPPATAGIRLSALPPSTLVGGAPFLSQAAPSSFAAETDPLHSNLMDEISNQIKATNSEKIVKLMRVANLALAVATVTVGVLAWICGHVNTFQKVIAGIYIIVFGLLLLAFEMRTEQTDVILRKNVGFMYGNKTRTVFLLFIAIWPLSMGNFWLTILDAMLLFLNAFFNYFVISQHPAFSTVLPVYERNHGLEQSSGNAPLRAHVNV